MPRFPRFIPIILSMLLPFFAMAGENPMLGIWCADNGEILFMQDDSIGFNEHTLCELERPLEIAQHLKFEISCANFYVHGNEIIKAFEESTMFEASLTPAAQLLVKIGNEATSMLFSRCK